MLALEQVCRELERLRQLRSVERCIVAPAAEAGHARAFFVSGGRIAAERTLPPGGGAYLEIEAGLAAARRIGEPGDLDELHLIGTFLRKPTAELTIVPLDRDAILRAAARSAAARAPARAAAARTPAPAPAAGSSLF
jgi:hypothetical protein